MSQTADTITDSHIYIILPPVECYSSAMETALDLLKIPPSVLHGQYICLEDSYKYDLESYSTQIVDCINIANSVLKKNYFRALKPYWSFELSF